ncbi:NUDIX hydrolase [Candidatus Roizmanbacteria bacterium]|jgi:ADP-ribose pyrophosphatase YjhB (NUDIX family)|nr:NUDIX hydrolase [Candidatus Roizmanbacteria bacterium]
MTKPFSYDEFREIYSKVPRLTVEVIIKTDKGIILTLRKLDSWKGQWHIPGGTVLYKETLERAAARIAEEELGVKIAINKQLGHIYYPSEEKERGFGWSIGIAFLCTIVSGTPRGSDQGEKIGAFEVLPKNTIAEAKEFLEKHLLNQSSV